MIPFTRLFDALYYQQEHYPKPDALCMKIDGAWTKHSNEDVINIVNQLSSALHVYGIQPNDKVAIVSPNRCEWNFVDLALQQIGAVSVPVYPTISENDYLFIFNDAEVKLCFVSDWDLYTKISNIKTQVTSLQDVYTFNEIEGAKHWRSILSMATPEAQNHVDTYKKTIDPNSLVTIIYTSGTTGNPKGVMLSHHNVVSNVKSVQPILPVNNNHRALSFLPLCHIFERVVFFYYTYVGVSIYYAENLETIGDNLKEVKPQFFSCVPRLLEKVYGKIVGKGLELKGIKKQLFFWALNLGLQYNEEENQGFWYNFQLKLANKLIFSKWREALGGNVLGIVTGAAALQPRLGKVFCAAGIPVREGYGQTESSPVISFNRFEKGGFKAGTIGIPIPGVEVKIDDKTGEILAKGPNIMLGYYKRPDLTAETIDADGWLHTGDKGEWDGKFLKITDRIKELFKTSGGKYVAPQAIENKLKECKLIEQVIVIGADQNFVSALIVPNFPNLIAYAEHKGIDTSDKKNILKNQVIIEKYNKEINEINQNFGKWEQVKKFELLEDEWSVDTGELTPTMKIKRKTVLEKYKTLIDKIYASSQFIANDKTIGG